MFATLAGGYNRRPNPGLPDLLGNADAALRAGAIDAAGHRAVADSFVREIVREMEIIELGIVSDGGVRSPDRTLPWIDGLTGLASGGDATLPDGEPVTRPVVTGRIAWKGPVTVRDWEFVDDATELFVKQTLIGPYTLATLAEPRPGRDRGRLAVELGEALNAELRALAAAGCPMVEVDEPMALRIGSDAREWRAFRGAHQALTHGLDDAGGGTGLHLSLGLWGGEVDRAGYATLLGLPFLSYLVDVLPGPSAWRFIAAVPPERGVIAGIDDVHTTDLQETEVIVWAMAWAARGERGQKRVGVAPSGSLSFVPRHFAHRKAQRLGEAIKIANAGPLQEVAEALDPDPLHSRMRALRTIAEAVEVADRT